MSIDSLSPELWVNILQSLSSPKDLGSAIRASSQFYRIFTTYRQSIQSAILLRAIPPAIEQDFSVALRAQQIWKFIPEYEDSARDLGDREAAESLEKEGRTILEQFQSKKSCQLKEIISDRTQLPDAWVFYSRCEFLIHEYIQTALTSLSDTEIDTSVDPSASSVTLIEHARFQRAFFRWEIYICLFQLSQVFCLDHRDPISQLDLASRFASELFPWEVEEIACIAQFHKRLIEELFDTIEDEFIKSAKVKMETIFRDPENDKERKPGDMLDWYGLFWCESHHKESWHAGHIDYLVSRGIMAARKMRGVPFVTARKMVLRSEFLAKGKLSILLGLKDIRSRAPEPVQCNQNEICQEESLDDCNFGWLWAMGNKTSTNVNAPANYDLRDQGYVFFEKTRLMKCPIFQSPRLPVDDWHDFSLGFQDRSELPSVEDRLNELNCASRIVGKLSSEVEEYDSENPDSDYEEEDEIDWRN